MTPWRPKEGGYLISSHLCVAVCGSILFYVLINYPCQMSDIKPDHDTGEVDLRVRECYICIVCVIGNQHAMGKFCAYNCCKII